MACYQEDQGRQPASLNVTWSEARWVAAVGLVLLLVTSLPTIYGYATTPSNKWFSGIVDNVHDTAQYLSWMQQAGSHLWSDNRLTSEATDPIFLNLHWWLVGRLAATTGLSLSAAYQGFRVWSVILLVVASYVVCAQLIEDPWQRRFAFVLSLVTSGIGWIWLIQKQFTGTLAFPLDVQNTLGNGFYTMTTSPHLTFAAALTLIVLWLAWRAISRGHGRSALAAGGLALFLGLGHIYDLVTIWAISIVFTLLLLLRDGFKWRSIWISAGIILISAPAALYWGWVSAHPLYQQALAQYDNLGVFTPNPLHLVLLLGIAFIVALSTFTGLVPLRQQSYATLFVKAWFCTTLGLIYLPLHFEVTLLTGYQLPVAVLATQGLFEHVFPWLQNRLGALSLRIEPDRIRRLLPALFLLAIIPTNLYLLSWRVLVLSRHDYPYYLNRDDVAAMHWLGTHTNPTTVVLSSFTIGHYLPGLTGDKAFLANAVMTINYNLKNGLVSDFYNPTTSDAERHQIIQQYGINYVYYGEAEKVVGSYDPAESPIFEQVFSSPQAAIFAVK